MRRTNCATRTGDAQSGFATVFQGHANQPRLRSKKIVAEQAECRLNANSRTAETMWLEFGRQKCITLGL